ncbi:PepSY-associated TM region [Cnuella takakiae]|uniref:PepSY-associated TM region n=1 Tax=Cnuella takakiae TaxID=1302690 RepID=A0A1M4XA45_9BACT|nr:PepSY domain-containing protein [Cnuella takakiae]OLY91488.1 hypothetical protein BUE76_05915 [Cnuella takakiae]SHE90281.1 PepSY-associated TM region [Cnuella takakiae]
MPSFPYFRRNAYRWHRITSLIVALPILLWTISGLLHPVINSSKPQVRNQSLPPTAIDTTRISLPLQQALQQNGIQYIHNFRIVKLYEVFYYQVQQPGIDTPTYINCASGTTLLNGDRNYAAYLAHQFLYAKLKGGTKQGGHHHAAAASILPASFGTAQQPLGKARIKSVQLLTHFDSEYKASNKILPVYRVTFDRADSIRLYIETPADRLVLAIDQRKAWFTQFFSITHSWSFLNGMGKMKSIWLGGFSLLCFASGVLGFYVYNITSKKKSSKGRPAAKTAHRVMGNVFMLTTLLYAFSGAWHSFQKLTPASAKQEYKAINRFPVAAAALDLKALMAALPHGNTLNDVSLVRMENATYWQATLTHRQQQQKQYYRTTDLQLLPDGDTRYGCYLACTFSRQSHHSIKHSRCLNSFNNDYSMMNKRLPVVEVGFDANNSYFVETSTGTLAAVSNAASRAERFIFSNLHMHHYWEQVLGRNVGSNMRNGLLIASTLGLLLVACTGMMIYARRKRQR